MFLIEYWIVIVYTHLLVRWRKALKTKNLKEQEAILRRSVEKMIRRRKENEALKGEERKDQIRERSEELENDQPKTNRIF